MHMLSRKGRSHFRDNLHLDIKHELSYFIPLAPHTVKLEFTKVYISFLFSLQSIDCEYSLELT